MAKVGQPSRWRSGSRWATPGCRARSARFGRPSRSGPRRPAARCRGTANLSLHGHVLEAQGREAESVGTARGRIGRGWAGRAETQRATSRRARTTPVSIAFPGPIMASHHPGEGSCSELAAWALARPVKTSTALSRPGLRRPQHSKAAPGAREVPAAVKRSGGGQGAGNGERPSLRAVRYPAAGAAAREPAGTLRHGGRSCRRMTYALFGRATDAGESTSSPRAWLLLSARQAVPRAGALGLRSGPFPGPTRAFCGFGVRNLKAYGFNDRIVSVEILRGRWLLCEHADFRGDCIVLRNSEIPDLAEVRSRRRRG